MTSFKEKRHFFIFFYKTMSIKKSHEILFKLMEKQIFKRKWQYCNKKKNISSGFCNKILFLPIISFHNHF